VRAWLGLPPGLSLSEGLVDRGQGPLTGGLRTCGDGMARSPRRSRGSQGGLDDLEDAEKGPPRRRPEVRLEGKAEGKKALNQGPT
jgi:hypothetical protein